MSGSPVSIQRILMFRLLHVLFYLGMYTRIDTSKNHIILLHTLHATCVTVGIFIALILVRSIVCFVTFCRTYIS